MKNRRYALIIVALITFAFACTTLTGGNASNSNQPVAGNRGEQSPTQTATAASIAVSETVPALEDSGSALRLEEELPPASFEEIYEAGLEEGLWTEGEGLVLFMQYFVGEVSEDQIPGTDEVVSKAGSGITHLVHDYINSPDADESIKAELERLVRVLFPPQDALDAVSTLAGLSSSAKLAAKAPVADAQSQQACMDFAGTGYEGNIDLGVTCYYYEEMDFGGRIFRVYFPEWWQGDEEKENQIGITMDALGEAAAVYDGFSALEIRNVNVVFAIINDEDGITNGEQYYFDTVDEACPITMFPLATQGTNETQYKQIVAHEMFHCVQDWSFPNTSPYSTHKWWMEGTAEYFSNLVYPGSNYEWRFLRSFNYASRNTPIFDMTYHNFAFFQFMGNKYSTEGLIDILMQVSAAGGQAGQESTLRGVNDFDENFNLFVVEYLSSGILDTGGGRIFSSPVTVTGMKNVNDKGEVQFTAQPFVAMRYGIYYKQEKRFLQTAENPDGTQFSSVEHKLRRNIGVWGDLPPEVRSECDDDIIYIFVPTTTKDGYTTYDANVTLAEKAECDPCLLGTWDIDHESYKMFIEKIMAEADTGGMAIDLSFDGHQYLQFETDGKLLTQLEDFSITINDQVTTTVNGSGLGTYSTTDGEKLTISGFVDYIDDVSLSTAGGQIAYTSETATFSFFGTDYSDPNIAMDPNKDSGPQNHAGEYVCNEETLTMIMQGYEQYGEVVFNRVEKILPTPEPTPAPADAESP